MPTISSQDLRDHTADVLRQVADGVRMTITVDSRPVAELGPLDTARRFLPKQELIDRLARLQADAACVTTSPG
jgi:prevent-host-death family protein